jgi:glycerol-3-phosphate acyltransferase PlsX
MRIALDAMGGDFAPGPNVTGAIDALKLLPELTVSLVGDAPRLEQMLQEAGHCGERIEIVPAESWITMDEKPAEAVRRKPKNSLNICWQLMADKAVDAVVSAGHTGAVVAAGLRTKLFLEGVKRPGIAVVLPTLRGTSVLMDVGANPQARSEHLYQYGVMGAIFAREILGIEMPRVGLMNIGSEDGKGNDLVREAHAFLAASHIQKQYIGNVEGRGIYYGDADVIICEGFVGNVVLKASEAMAEMLIRTASKHVLAHLTHEKEAAAGAFRSLSQQFAYSESGGAPLLGIDGICMICHGSSDARAITNALKAAMKFKTRNINEQIVDELARAPV